MTPSPDSSYREIPLTQGQVAIVDAADFDWLNQWKWCAIWQKNVNGFYAARNVARHEIECPYLMTMHRQILGLGKGDRRVGDHRFHNTLDNRRSIDGEINLRIATRLQNSWNSKMQSNNKHGFKGVVADKRRGTYYARICVNGKTLHVASRSTPEAASVEYDAAALKHFGAFAYRP